MNPNLGHAAQQLRYAGYFAANVVLKSNGVIT